MRFNQSEYAEFYHKQQLETGYPGKLLPFILDELKDSNSIIDIGSGTGFFTIPLAEAGHKVTSVEPSAEMINMMINIMKRNLNNNIPASINICQNTWENWKGEFHDAAISVHSLYPMADIKESLNLINISAAKKIIIVRDSEKMRTITKIIREKFGIFTNIDLNSDIVLFLDERSIKYRVVNIYEERKYFIKDIHQTADSICYQLKLSESENADVVEIIKDEMVSSLEGDYFNTIYSDNVYVF